MHSREDIYSELPSSLPVSAHVQSQKHLEYLKYLEKST